jgi:hypothetical protein
MPLIITLHDYQLTAQATCDICGQPIEPIQDGMMYFANDAAQYPEQVPSFCHKRTCDDAAEALITKGGAMFGWIELSAFLDEVHLLSPAEGQS